MPALKEVIKKSPWMKNPAAIAYWQQVRDGGIRVPEPEPAGYQCSVCGDLGYISYDVPYGHPDFGKLFPCPSPDCATVDAQRSSRYARLCTAAQIPEAYINMTFGAWDALTHTPELMAGKWDALGAARAFVKAKENGYVFDLRDAAARIGAEVDEQAYNAERRCNSIIFAGRQGVGKTSLACSIASALLARGVPCMYLRLSEMLDAMQRRFEDAAHPDDGLGKTAGDVLETFQHVDVLVIDEFGLTKVSDWRRDRVEQLVNFRYTHKLPTIFTTNLTQTQLLGMWGLTTGHRMQAMAHWIEVGGPELRERGQRVVSR